MFAKNAKAGIPLRLLPDDVAGSMVVAILDSKRRIAKSFHLNRLSLKLLHPLRSELHASWWHNPCSIASFSLQAQKVLSVFNIVVQTLGFAAQL